MQIQLGVNESEIGILGDEQTARGNLFNIIFKIGVVGTIETPQQEFRSDKSNYSFREIENHAITVGRFCKEEEAVAAIHHQMPRRLKLLALAMYVLTRELIS